MLLCGESLRYSAIKQCRLTALATPQVCLEVDVTINLTPCCNGYMVQATVSDDKQTYMLLKGQLYKS